MAENKEMQEMREELKALRRQINAQAKPGTVINFFTGLTNRVKRPLVNIVEEGAELNAKSHFSNLKQADIEEKLAAERKNLYAKAGHARRPF